MGELTPVYEIDGRFMGATTRKKEVNGEKEVEKEEETILQRIQKEYRILTATTGYKLPF